MLQTNALRRLFRIAGVSLVLLCAGTWGALAMLDARERSEVERAVDGLIAAMGITDDLAFDEKADRVRTFVNGNSIHEIDDEFYSYWHDLPQVIERLLAFSEGSGPPPHLECSSRTELMEAVFQRLGYDTRSVVLYEPAEGFPSRTFLEVQNPETGAWQMQDADFGVFWRDAATLVRASIYDLIAAPMGAVEPCNEMGCGWTIKSPEGKKLTRIETYVGLASVLDREDHFRPLLVNELRFDLDAPQLVDDDPLTYCEYVEKNCRQQIVRFGTH